MRRCQFVHDLRQCPVAVSSPQTQPQRDQVTRIINRLMTQNRFLRRTLSDSSLTEPSSPTHERSPRSGHTTPIPNRTKMPSEHDHVETPESSPSKPGSGNDANGGSGGGGGGGGVTPESAQKKEFSISASFKQLFKKTPQKSASGDADTTSGSAVKAASSSASNTNTGSSSGGAIDSETDSNSGGGGGGSSSGGHVRMDVPGDNAAQGGSGSPRPPSIVQPPPSSSIFRSFRGLGNK